ncbi:MAG: hypothetical protein IJ251_09315 [Oscillospiraceae bacterium]|nr:hypothetical protein [Oscillospiraceae bacterium]
MKNRSPGLITALADTFTDKLIITAFAAAVCTIPLRSAFMWEMFACALLLAGGTLAVNFALARKGVTRKMIREQTNSLDPKITGYVSDIRGIGSLMSALAAVSYALSQLYLIADEDGSVALTALSIVAGTVMIAVILCMTTSADTLYRMAFTGVSDLTGAKGNDLFKAVGKMSHSHQLTGSLRRMSLIAFSAQVGISLLFVVSSLTSVGLPFPLSGAAMIYVLLALITLGGSKAEVTYGSDKLRLFEKGRSFGVINTVMYIIISLAVMYTFPFRSVYTSYTVRYDFSYHDEAPEGIHLLSVPTHDADSAPLFMGMFVLTAMAVIVQAFISVSYDPTFSQKGSSKSVLMIFLGMVFTGAYALVYSLFKPEYAMNAVMWLVSISLSCLILGVNLIRVLIVSGRTRAENEEEE